jgi:hypothetical protein
MVARAGVLRRSVIRKLVAMVARAGVQPATFALGVRCSMQLSYRATWLLTIRYQCIAADARNWEYAAGSRVRRA